MKYFIVLFSVCTFVFSSNNFTEGMRAYKKGDFSKAKVLLEVALEKDKVFNAGHILGKMYLEGKGVHKNLDKAIKYFEFAHKFGNISAGCYASSAYMDKGIYNWGVLEDGLAKGLKKRVPFCMSIVDRWINK